MAAAFGRRLGGVWVAFLYLFLFDTFSICMYN
jgi:hypothetical protein